MRPFKLLTSSLTAFSFLAIIPSQASGQGNMAGMAGMPGMPMMMSTPLGVPMERMGSGTTWIPDASPIPTLYRKAGGWDLTSHGFVFGEYLNAGGQRGDTKFGSLNWVMAMASHELAGGMIQLRSMLSLDVLTMGRAGYPLLLQSGESLDDQPLHDRQHPHDFWMELGALYLRRLSNGVGMQIYLAPSGEPALGPVAFMHRPSAMDNADAPIGHHWQDATHIQFGVATLGIFTSKWKLEGSLFNGREPDDARWDFDFGKLDSYSARLTVNPSIHWSATAGYGKLNLGEDSMHRFTASILHGTHIGANGQLATSLIYGTNKEAGEPEWSHSVLLESEAVLDRSNTVFARIEQVEKSAADLVLADSAANFTAGKRFSVRTVSAGYIREFATSKSATIGIGVRGSLSLVSEALSPFYGSRSPKSVSVFVRVRPVASMQ